MSNDYLYSVIFDLQALRPRKLPTTTGHQTHGAFLDLVRQIDPPLASRLHDEPNYRPFTVSPLWGLPAQRDGLRVCPGQPAQFRVTLLDGSRLWRCLGSRLLVAEPLELRIGAADFVVERVLATSETDPSGWAGYTDWRTLASTPAQPYLTLEFATPTAFNLGDKHFALLPDPHLVWDSLLRVWNTYAPESLRWDKTVVREFVSRALWVADHALHTTLLQYPKHKQKGFVGTCTYQVQTSEAGAPAVAALAAFAQYAGVGYQTTMGMGQARLRQVSAALKSEM